MKNFKTLYDFSDNGLTLETLFIFGSRAQKTMCCIIRLPLLLYKRASDFNDTCHQVRFYTQLGINSVDWQSAFYKESPLPRDQLLQWKGRTRTAY